MTMRGHWQNPWGGTIPKNLIHVGDSSMAMDLHCCISCTDVLEQVAVHEDVDGQLVVKQNP